MQTIWMLLSFLAKAAAATVLCFGGARAVWGKPQSGLQFAAYALLAYVAGFALALLWQAVVWPLYVSPLRNLPKVQSGYDARLFLEGPRGKTPLKWVKRMPDAGLILSEGMYGQHVLFPVSPAALRDVLYTNSYDFEKPLGLRAYLCSIIGLGLICSEGPFHKAERRNLTPAFNIKHMRALYPTMWSKAGLFLDVLDREMRRAGNVEVTSWTSRFALDVIGCAALSSEFDALKRPDHHPLAHAFSVLMEPEPYLVILLLLSMIFPPWLTYNLPLRANREIKTNAAYITKSANDILATQQRQMASTKGAAAAADAGNNILSHILQSDILSPPQIVDEIKTLIGAGHETSAASITWATHLLTLPRNRHYQQTLRDEIRRAFPPSVLTDPEPANAAHVRALETLPYLNGCCEEVLRLFPPVPATLRESTRTTSIDGTVVPKGVMTVVMPYVINRNPKYWGDDADEFRPERWIDKLSDGSLRVNKNGGTESNYCHVTFLHGPRACIGRDFARAELKVAIAAIFGRFDVARLEGDDGSQVRIKGAVTTKPQGGLRVSLTRVDGW